MPLLIYKIALASTLIRPSQHCCLLTYQAALSTLLFAHLPSCLKLTIPYSTLIRPSDTIVSSPTMLPEADHHTLISTQLKPSDTMSAHLPSCLKLVPSHTLWLRPSDTIVSSPTKLPEAANINTTNVGTRSHTLSVSVIQCQYHVVDVLAVHHCTHAR